MMKTRRPASALLLVCLGLGVATLSANSQRPPALAAWDRYTTAVDARHADTAGPHFFALDTFKVGGWRERARAGTIPMHDANPARVDGGKLHHWTGAVFVPGRDVEAVVQRLLDYAGRESEFYEEVKASKLLDRQEDRVRVFMRLYRDAGPVEATYNTEHAVEYRRLGPTRAASRSVSTKIAELAAPGTPRERERAPGTDSGYLWRLNAYWRFEEWGNGALVECESVSLSRSVPFLIRPLADPIVDRIARESLERTLRSLKVFLGKT